jgi:hypothetical protein
MMERTTEGLWLEIIKLQSPKDAEGMVKGIIDSVRRGLAVENAKEVQVFSNAVGDIAIHISWRSDRTTPEGSTVALQLAAALSEYGLINHTFWTEEV